MLTSIAILERELGSNDYARHLLWRRLTEAPADEAEILREQIAGLESRRATTLRLLEDLHAERSNRRPDAGRAARARPARKR